MLRTGELYNITKKKSTKDQSGFSMMSSSVYQNLPLAEHMAFPFKQSYIEKSLKPNDIRAMTDNDCEIMYHIQFGHYVLSINPTKLKVRTPTMSVGSYLCRFNLIHILTGQLSGSLNTNLPGMSEDKNQDSYLSFTCLWQTTAGSHNHQIWMAS